MAAPCRHGGSPLRFLASFRLPHKGAGALAAQFPFPREDRITFNEEKHEYTIDGVIKAPRSATGLLGEYKPGFDAAGALHAMKNGRDWETKRAAFEASGVSTEGDGILQAWQRNGEIARARGHLLHYQAPWPCSSRLVAPSAALCLNAGAPERPSRWSMAGPWRSLTVRTLNRLPRSTTISVQRAWNHFGQK